MSLNLIPDDVTLRVSKVNNAYWSEACWSCLQAGDKSSWWWVLFASLTSVLGGKGKGLGLTDVLLHWKRLLPVIFQIFHLATWNAAFGWQVSRCVRSAAWHRLEDLGWGSFCFWSHEDYSSLPVTRLLPGFCEGPAVGDWESPRVF